MRDVEDLGSMAVGASGTQRSIIPADLSLLFHDPRGTVTFPAARSPTMRLATVKVIGGNCWMDARLRPFVKDGVGTWTGATC